MASLTGYWIGEATGTNSAGFALTLEQTGNAVSGTAKISEPLLGVCECNVTGQVHVGITLNLAPTRNATGIDLGEVIIVGRLKGDNEIAGKWSATIGAEGILTMKRVDLAAMESALPISNSVFIVHGHDEGAKQAVARFLERLGLKPVILQEQLNRGMTVIEKFEDYAERAGFAVILITPDDDGYPKGREEQKRSRARQNVILELGYFAAKLGRERTVVLTKGDVELPSDVMGLIYESMDHNEGWKMRLARELKVAGFSIDLNDAIA
ncbi:MAG: nucleotide-binding protein [Acidobacteria bacterium]|nr:nucleotide-binding protein [Acidobacteriota bacterium]